MLAPAPWVEGLGAHPRPPRLPWAVLPSAPLPSDHCALQVPGLTPAEPPQDEPDEERPCPPSLQDAVVRYLRRHRSHLPMYAQARTNAAAPMAAGKTQCQFGPASVKPRRGEWGTRCAVLGKGGDSVRSPGERGGLGA